MNWKNLLLNFCPQCNADWDTERPEEIEILSGTDTLIKCACDFKIKQSRKEEILESLENPEPQEYESDYY